MFISMVLRMEYSPCRDLSKLYQQGLNACVNNNWILVTNEYLQYHYEEMQDSISDRLMNEFELQKISQKEFNDIEKYYIPDNLFISKEKELGSRTEMLSYLSNSSFPELERCLNDILYQIERKHPNDKIEGVLFSGETFYSIRDVFEKRNIQLYPYLFSAIKKAHGYRQSLYYTGINGFLYNNAKSCEKRFEKYLQCKDANLPIFTNKEILAILGKDRTMPLLQLINHAPQYEMGICTELRAIIPSISNYNLYTDDDLFEECNKLYQPTQITTRSHAVQLDQRHLKRDEIHNDAAPFILSCRRLTSVSSQISLKVLLWKRTAVMKKPTMAFSFLCTNDYTSKEVADIVGLNYYVFCYLVPNDLMFSDTYWKWRITNPTESEIYRKHLDYYMEKLNLPKSILTENDETVRLRQILESRNCDSEVVNDVIEDNQDFDVDYYAASSKFMVNGKPHWRLNKRTEDGKLKCTMRLSATETNEFEFYPLDDVAGFSVLKSVMVNGNELQLTDEQKGYKFMKKVSGHYTFTIANTKDLNTEIVWKYKRVFDYLNSL